MDIIETMTPQEAAERLRATGMHIGVETLRQGLQQGAFPFGTYIQSATGGPVYFVYARLLEEWIKARAKENAPAKPEH